jgi:hypothetical protein
MQELDEALQASEVDLENANAEVERVRIPVLSASLNQCTDTRSPQLSSVLREVEEDRDVKAEEIAGLNAELDEAEMKIETAERRDQALKEVCLARAFAGHETDVSLPSTARERGAAHPRGARSEDT